MTNLERIQKGIEELDRAEYAAFRAWLDEHDWERWDREIEEDAAAGKLDELMNEAREAHRRGETTELGACLERKSRNR